MSRFVCTAAAWWLQQGGPATAVSCEDVHDETAGLSGLVLTLLLPPAGPGKAWSAKEQGEYLFELSGKKPKFIRAPIGLMDGIISVFDGLARVFPALEVSFGLLRGSKLLTV